ncbi:Heme uptake protein MmpL11 [bacterium HR25]|jgi:RND superfamily putative drug exporter|nr:Heme uptake protein MmpL11 [bacterium HR25]
MTLRISTGGLARASARRPWTVLALWLVVLLLAGLLAATALDSALTSEASFTNSPESQRAEELLEERLRGPQPVNEIVIVRSPDRTVDDPAFRQFVEGLFQRLTALGPQVIATASNFYLTGDSTLVSADRHSTIVPLVMAGSIEDAERNIGQVREIVREANGQDGFSVLITGSASISEDFSKVAERDLRTAEAFGIPVALLVLVLVFGAIAAAFLPLVIAGISIAIAMGAAALVGQLFELTFFVTNMITMIGLAVGIDYSLFIVSRYREERRRGLPREAAIAMAGATASRAVFISGLTVVLAMAGLLIVPTTIFRSLALGAILVVLVTVAAALTLLPAALGLLGDRIDALRIPFIQRRYLSQEERSGGMWDRIARAVMRRPVLSLLVSAGALVALTVPYFDIHTGVAGVSTLPDSFESKQGFMVLQQEFSAGLVSPVEIVIDGPVASEQVQAGIQRLEALMASNPIFGPPHLVTNQTGDLALLSVPVAAESTSDEAMAAVRLLREEYVPQAFAGVPARVLVGGSTALNMDFFDLAETYTPIVFAFVLGLSFLLLLLVFRSLVIPVKAVIMNLLSVGAAYGLVVLVTQKGVGAGLLGFQQVDTVEAWIPIFLFTVLFGLSMDYHVFLLSRIRERFDETGNNTEAVAFGLRSTGRLITGAALIMVVVFAGFAAGELVMFQQLGFGAAVAVLLDATVVRSVLVPASMQLLGRWNWYLPRWLSWLPDLSAEGPALQPAQVYDGPTGRGA